MALNVCDWCGTKFAIGCEHCPQCGNADYYEEGTMAKISRHGGPSSEHVVGERGPELIPGDLPAHIAEQLADDALVVAAPADAPELGSGDAFLALISDESAEEAPAPAEEPEAVLFAYELMLRTVLQDLCRERGLPTSGNKDEIVARLVAADASAALEE